MNKTVTLRLEGYKKPVEVILMPEGSMASVQYKGKTETMKVIGFCGEATWVAEFNNGKKDIYIPLEWGGKYPYILFP